MPAPDPHRQLLAPAEDVARIGDLHGQRSLDDREALGAAEVKVRRHFPAWGDVEFSERPLPAGLLAGYEEGDGVVLNGVVDRPARRGPGLGHGWRTSRSSYGSNRVSFSRTSTSAEHAKGEPSAVARLAPPLDTDDRDPSGVLTPVGRIGHVVNARKPSLCLEANSPVSCPGEAHQHDVARRCARRRARRRGRHRRRASTRRSTGTAGRGSTGPVRRDGAALLLGPAVLAGDRELDPRDVLAEACAPDDVGDVQDAPVVEQRPPVADPGDARVGALHSGAARCARLTRSSGPPPARIFGRSRRPIGVPIVSTRFHANHSSGSTPRPTRPSSANGISPCTRPDSTVAWSAATSSAMSAPEWLPPTTSVGPAAADTGGGIARVQLPDRRVQLGCEAAPSAPGTCRRRRRRCRPRSGAAPRARRSGRRRGAARRPRRRSRPAARSAARRTRGSPPARPWSGTSRDRAAARSPAACWRAGLYSRSES